MIYPQLSHYIALIIVKDQFKHQRIIDKLSDFKYYYPNIIEIGVKSTMGKIDTKYYSNTMHPNNY
jgi:hypothetical protein